MIEMVTTVSCNHQWMECIVFYNPMKTKYVPLPSIWIFKKKLIENFTFSFSSYNSHQMNNRVMYIMLKLTIMTITIFLLTRMALKHQFHVHWMTRCSIQSSRHHQHLYLKRIMRQQVWYSEATIIVYCAYHAPSCHVFLW